mgnify:CR=1 FL=1
MNDIEIYNLFSQSLFSDVLEDEQFYHKKPLLAHYTTLSVLEKILDTDEIWFSNPLCMNDYEEVKFGISEGMRLIDHNEEIEAVLGEQRAARFRHFVDHYYNDYDNNHVINTYVFCTSEHQRDDYNGMLSMWRGYGANGGGVAIVFDTAQIEKRDDTPLFTVKVSYDSREKRIEWLKNKLHEFIEILKATDLPDDKLYLPANALFERIKMFAISTKDIGFKEEGEWRSVYLSERDNDRNFKDMFGYYISPRGIEPKLKFKILPPIEGLGQKSFSDFVDRIILGPTLSSALAETTVKRMLYLKGKPELADKLHRSKIPFRSIQ